MTDREERLKRAQMGVTALGRLHLRVIKDDGVEDMLLERRWPDAVGARNWCERMAGDSAADVEVLEIHVIVEQWQHPKSWETTGPRPVAESIQVGVPDSEGGIRWSTPQSSSARSSAPLSP